MTTLSEASDNFRDVSTSFDLIRDELILLSTALAPALIKRTEEFASLKDGDLHDSIRQLHNTCAQLRDTLLLSHAVLDAVTDRLAVAVRVPLPSRRSEN